MQTFMLFIIFVLLIGGIIAGVVSIYDKDKDKDKDTETCEENFISIDGVCYEKCEDYSNALPKVRVEGKCEIKGCPSGTMGGKFGKEEYACYDPTTYEMLTCLRENPTNTKPCALKYMEAREKQKTQG